jgi:osmoprotectant transport system ATP-binding protein
MIQFEHVSKNYGKTPILKDLSFTIPDGQFVVLIGPSGCGKTTTMKMINRLLEPDKGTVLIDGKDIKTEDKVSLRRHIGYVIQQIGLFPNMTVAQNICVVPRLLKYDKTKCDEIVADLLKMVNMEQYAHKYPSELSGGQQQRIGVLRALAASPPIVLMDEPFSALDPMTREILQDEVKNIQQKLNKTIIFVSHDMDEALKLADIIIFMSKGEIVQMASPEEMLENPANDLVRDFLGKHTSDFPAPSKVESFMRTNVRSVRKDRGVRECAERMARYSVDTLLVVDGEKRYLGTVSIGDIRHWGKELTNIEPLIRQTARTARVGDDAKESFDYLLDSGINANYVVVLNEDDTIAGLVTKTSVARSVAETLWGDVK